MCRRRGLLPLLLTLALGAVAPSAAGAATVRLGDRLPIEYTAGAGEANRLDVVYGSRSVVLRDAGATITETDDGPCRVRADRHSAICPMARVHAFLGDRDDQARLSGAVRRSVMIRGEDGGDTLTVEDSAPGRLSTRLGGGRGGDTLLGGPRSEALDGGGDRDTLRGGGGDDHLTDGDGRGLRVRGEVVEPATPVDADTIDGGDGRDQVSYLRGGRESPRPEHGVTVDLADEGRGHGEPGENDTLTSIEGATGGSGDDDLRGDAGANLLDGAAGDDALTGRGGNDRLIGDLGVDESDGGPGDDRLELTDYASRASESANCGDGFDYAIGTYPGDLVEADCERVRPRGDSSRGFGIELRRAPAAVDEGTGVVAFRIRCSTLRRFVGCRGRLAVAPGAENRPEANRSTVDNHGTRFFDLRPGRWSTVRVRLDAAGRTALQGPGTSPFEVQVRRYRTREYGGSPTRIGGYTTRF